MLVNEWVRLSFINVGVCRGSKGRLGRNQGGLKGTNLTARRKTIFHGKLVELSKLIPYLEWSRQVFWLVIFQHYLFTLAVAMKKWTTWRRCVFVCCPRLAVCSILLVRVNRILHSLQSWVLLVKWGNTRALRVISCVVGWFKLALQYCYIN